MTDAVPHSDILDPEWWRRDPRADYAALRDHDGLWRDRRSGIWLATRHADVLTVERDATTFTSRHEQGGTYRLNPSPGEQTMISKDDPAHLAQRRIINRRFTPRAVRTHADHYRALVEELVDGAVEQVAEHGAVEVVDALAAQLPCRVTAELLHRVHHGEYVFRRDVVHYRVHGADHATASRTERLDDASDFLANIGNTAVRQDAM